MAVNIKKSIKKTESEFIDIARRIKKRDFSGNSGQAIKNSTWQLLTLIVAKFGSLLFTIILARILMPELFGLYGLAIATILFLGGFSEIGINTTLLTFLSKYIDKDKRKAKAYFYYLTKYKILFIMMGSLLIIIFAHYFANVYYQKPIFYAIVAGVLYFPLTFLYKYVGMIFFAKNNFRIHFYGEIFYQILRIVLVSLVAYYIVLITSSQELIIMNLVLASSLCFFVVGIYFLTSFSKENPFKNLKEKRLSEKEKKEIWIFTLPLTFTIFSGIFFNYIDTIMLGKYVDASYIGFYRAAFTLIAAAAAIVSFSAVPLMPVFSRMSGEKLRKGFRKARNITLILSITSAIITIIISKYVILIIYGPLYNQSIIILQFFSLLLISIPITSLYETYYTSQKKTKEYSILLFLTTILNIILNVAFIQIGLQRNGMIGAVIGACVATIISRYIYLIGLGLYKKKIESQIK